jgi:predicted ATPase
LVFQGGTPPQARYLFKHALVQDTAYQSLLKSRRQQLHQIIGKVLEERFPQIVATQPELVAHHYTEAGLIAQAIPYWRRAGRQAIERSANEEAISHLTTGLDLLRLLPDTPERSQQELELQITLGPAEIALKGWAAPEVEKTYTRAQELCQHLGETSELFSVLFGLQACYVHQAKLQTARELAEQGFALAQKLQDPALVLESHHMLVYNLVYLGELTLAREYSEGITLYDPPSHPLGSYCVGDDPVVCCLSHRAFALWTLGYPDQALKSTYDALTQAKSLSHPLSLALALTFVAVLHQFRRERQTEQEWAEAAMALATEQGFLWWVAWGTILRGWALTDQGRREGIAQIRQGLAASQAIGSVSWRPYHLALLAEAYGNVRKIEEGLSTLTEALAWLEQTGERLWEAELYRVKGELTLLQAETHKAKVEEAEACFLKAIEVARQQQAKTLELRATTSLAQLWRSQDKRADAHRLLSEIYNWFTEGFDTKDLQEAKALLDELS